MFIVNDDSYSDSWGSGRTLKDAVEDYGNNGGERPAQELLYYEAEPIQVEIVFVKKETVSKIVKKKISNNACEG